MTFIKIKRKFLVLECVASWGLKMRLLYRLNVLCNKKHSYALKWMHHSISACRDSTSLHSILTLRSPHPFYRRQFVPQIPQRQVCTIEQSTCRDQVPCRTPNEQGRRANITGRIGRVECGICAGTLLCTILTRAFQLTDSPRLGDSMVWMRMAFVRTRRRRRWPLRGGATVPLATRRPRSSHRPNRATTRPPPLPA
jgi:hypothetical protein